MRGVLLNPRTGRPIDTGLLNEAAGELSRVSGLSREEVIGRLPDSVLANLAMGRKFPRGSGPRATKQGFYELLAVDLADGTQILNSTVEAIICPDYVFAGNDPHIYPGASFNVKCYGDVSFVITTPGTLTFRVRWGGVAGTVLAASGAYAPDPTAALANRSYMLDFDIVWRTIGAAGTAFCMGQMYINDYDDASATTLQGNLNMGLYGSAGANTPAVVSALDTTTAKNLSVTAQFSVSTATTQLTNHIRRLACLN